MCVFAYFSPLDFTTEVYRWLTEASNSTAFFKILKFWTPAGYTVLKFRA